MRFRRFYLYALPLNWADWRFGLIVRSVAPHLGGKQLGIYLGPLAFEAGRRAR